MKDKPICICTECEHKNQYLFCTFWAQEKKNGFVVKCDAFKKEKDVLWQRHVK